ncbi:23S rRNA methyltransferase [Actinokineospora auranticolor]|uniref:23S rRNA (Guanine745-N1)-methyltransferase n=1 Tax=Actinokineospora auranticolor TaxID=155976 RepID=A0A2S6GYY1_9PSEU|nr:methyltransferase domain-containing protein [Actinokineospora auranticolor]PPK70370.1 23S rRNA (guanine745-N1)-methyltransferase [Actinokineospora auranticolor]
MLTDVLPYLVCPHCGSDLDLSGNSLRCPNRHTFDIARQGYVSLLREATAFTGDTAEMADARAAFLGAGHYALIEWELCLVPPGPGCVVDVGAGIGHYLAEVLSAHDRAGIAVDASKPALRRAARAHPRIGAVLADVWRPLPIRSGAAGLVLNVFAPRNPAELHRVLHPDGRLVVVAPTAGHLAELVSTVDMLTVGAGKRDQVDAKLAPYFTPEVTRTCEFEMALAHADAAALVGMGPSAFHADRDTIAARVAALPEPVRVTGSVSVTTYQPVSTPRPAR